MLRAATGFMVAGAVALAAGIVVNTATAGESPLWWLHDSDSLGRFLPVVGTLLAGIGIVRHRVLGRWAGVALVVAALACFQFNAQDARVLFALPLGPAWVAVGFDLTRQRSAR